MSESFDGLGRKRNPKCSAGHEFTEANTYWSVNWKGYNCRGCRECQKQRMQRKRDNPDFKANEAAKMRRWRVANPETNRVRWQRDHEEKKQILLTARVGGCIGCGEKDPSCLDFHHGDGKTDKLGDISKMRRFGKVRLLAEIEKCDVLCSNCHRKHHRDERQTKVLEGV